MIANSCGYVLGYSRENRCAQNTPAGSRKAAWRPESLMLMTKRPEIADESWPVDAYSLILRSMEACSSTYGASPRPQGNCGGDGLSPKDVKNEGRPGYVYENK